METTSGRLFAIPLLAVLASCDPATDALPGPDGPPAAGEAPGEAELPAFFVTGDIDGHTHMAAHNVSPVATGREVIIAATEEPSKGSAQWYVAITIPATGSPVTVSCPTPNGVYQVAFLGASGPSFSSRGTGICSFTFVEPRVAGTLEGTFTAVMRDNAVQRDHVVTNGRFRLPRAP
jgi:hypothetical protein